MTHSKSFARLSTQGASTKRSPSAVGGVVGTPTTYLSNITILPLMPVSNDIALRYNLETPRESFVTYVQGIVDIDEGDFLVVSSVDYPIRAAQPWPAHNYTEVIVDSIVGT